MKIFIYKCKYTRKQEDKGHVIIIEKQEGFPVWAMMHQERLDLQFYPEQLENWRKQENIALGLEQCMIMIHERIIFPRNCLEQDLSTLDTIDILDQMILCHGAALSIIGCLAVSLALARLLHTVASPYCNKLKCYQIMSIRGQNHLRSETLAKGSPYNAIQGR